MYVQALAVVSPRKIFLCLKDRSFWALSIAIDRATVMSSYYLDMRVRFYSGQNIYNLHSFAIPLNVSHADAHMLDVVSKVLDSIAGKD